MLQNFSLGIFPGSFDPFTNGHADIVERTLNIFDRVIVAVAADSKQNLLFSIDERLQLIREVTASAQAKIEVCAFNGLLADFVRERSATCIVRGLRAISDYDYETQMALMNRKLWVKAETIFLVAKEENSYVSSSMVRQVARLGGDVQHFVAPVVAQALKDKFSLSQQV